MIKSLNMVSGIKGLGMRRSLLALIALSVISVTVITFAFSITKPYTLDEVEEARMAQKINFMGPKTFHPSPEGGGEDISHPLLYSYLNAIFYRLFGPAEVSLRSFGILWFIFSLLLLLRFTHEIFKEESRYNIAAKAVTASLYLLNPLLIQHSMLLNNSDNTILTFAIILFVFQFYRFEELKSGEFLRSRFVMAFAMAFCFWGKELTPIFLVGAVIIYRVINREFKRLMLDLSITILLGIAIFWAGWYLYCYFTGTDVMGFIRFTLTGKGKKITLKFLLDQVRFFFVFWKWPFYWAGAPFFILVFIAIFERLKVFVKERRLQRLDFILLAAISIFTPYHFVKASIDMMKYQYPTYPLFIIIISWLIIKRVVKGSDSIGMSGRAYNILLSGFILFLAAASFWYYRVGDYILMVWNKLPSDFYRAYFIPLAAWLAVFMLLFRKLGLYRVLLCGLLVFVYPINIGLDLNQTRDYTTAECWLNYGEKGLRDTVGFLKDNIDTDLMTYARKDIAYYLQYRYGIDVQIEPVDKIFLTRDEKILDALFIVTPIQYLVIDRVSAAQRANPDIWDILHRHFFLEKPCGDFFIMKNRRLRDN